MSITYQFDLSHLDPDRTYTFHKRGRVYPVHKHTRATLADALSADGRVRAARQRITHYVPGVATSPSDGVVIQSVRTPVAVDGPKGPGTQTYNQLVTFAISIPGADSPLNDAEDLACALLFLHNNLANLSSQQDFAVPSYILDTCIRPNAGDLAQQLSELPLQGESWISDPYAVMTSATQHLLYPSPPTPDAFANDPLLWREGRDPLIENLLRMRKQPTDSGSQPGDWVYSQRLNFDALQPALSGSLGAALRAAKNAEELEGVTWNVQNAVASSDYGATTAAPRSRRSAAAETTDASATDETAATDADAVTWTVTNLSPGSGLSVDASSLKVDMSKDTDNPDYAGQLTLACTNNWLRHLSAYVQFLKYQGEGSSATLVPIDLGASDTEVIKPDPTEPGHKIHYYVNTKWPGDFCNVKDPLWSGMGFIEPDHTKKFLNWVSPTGTICGIPVPAAPTTLTVDYMPKDANVVRIMWGGLGRGPYDQDVCALGISFTAVFELALPMILLMYDAATVDSVALTESVWNHKGTMFNLAKTIVGVVMNTKLNADTMIQQDAEAIGKFLAESLLPDLLQTGCAYGVILLAQIAVGAVVESIPFLDIASLIFNGAITVAQLSQTIVEVVDSPFVFTTDIARTFDLVLTLEPDATMHEFPPEAIGGTYQVAIAFSTNATPAVTTLPMPATTRSDPLQVSFTNLPAGGQIQVSSYCYSPTGWQAGQGQSAWVDAKGDGTGPHPSTRTLSVTVTNNAPPLDEFSVYQFTEKTVLDGGARQWLGTTSEPPATQPVATVASETGLTRLGGLTISQSAGMLGYSYQTDASRFTVENVSLLQNPQSAYAAAGGIVVTPGLAYQRTGPYDGSGLNFYLDANPATNIDQEAHLRRLELVWTQGGGSQPPDLNPDPTLSWGRFPFPMDRVAAFNDYVAGISFDVNHSKVYVLQVPATGQSPQTAPKAVMFAGPGTRIGLISVPRALTFGMQGQIFVLEQGTCRIQAFDTSGNPLPCFDPTGSGTTQAVMPLANATDQTVWLDVAVEPQGYLYVLSYEGVGAAPEDYHLDLYRPDGSFLARTDDFAAAAIAVDIIRDVYTLNYEVLQAADGPEPSVSLWVPPVKSYRGSILSITGTSLVLQESPQTILTVSTDASTVVRLNDVPTTLADLEPGQSATAFGAMSSSGVLFATQLFATS
ncbi:MAG: hypothetical protein IPL41_01370 [Micropruina sp.]|nr:hypothetical protein [Micropruina sp.]